MRLLLTVSMACLVFFGQAQDKLKFNSRNFAGILEGSGGTAFQLLTVNGISYKKNFLGIGTGLDYYQIRSVPLFLNFSRDLKSGPRSFFLSGSGGYSFAWKKAGSGGWFQSESTPSLYAAGHIGYRVNSRNQKDAFLFSLGYSYKHQRETRTYMNFCTNPPCTLSTEVLDFYFKRISLLLGWQF